MSIPDAEGAPQSTTVEVRVPADVEHHQDFVGPLRERVLEAARNASKINDKAATTVFDDFKAGYRGGYDQSGNRVEAIPTPGSRYYSSDATKH